MNGLNINQWMLLISSSKDKRRSSTCLFLMWFLMSWLTVRLKLDDPTVKSALFLYHTWACTNQICQLTGLPHQTIASFQSSHNPSSLRLASRLAYREVLLTSPSLFASWLGKKRKKVVTHTTSSGLLLPGWVDYLIMLHFNRERIWLPSRPFDQNSNSITSSQDLSTQSNVLHSTTVNRDTHITSHSPHNVHPHAHLVI